MFGVRICRVTIIYYIIEFRGQRTLVEPQHSLPIFSLYSCFLLIVIILQPVSFYTYYNFLKLTGKFRNVIVSFLMRTVGTYSKPNNFFFSFAEHQVSLS